MKHQDLTAKIIQCAYKVHNTLGFGFLESVYKKGMVIELTENQLRVEEEKPLKVYYAKQVIGDFYVDLLVENEIVIELKSVEKLAKAHEV
ncbi:MAG: GxxExxY protein, partial [Desulfatiglandales bacterium]